MKKKLLLLANLLLITTVSFAQNSYTFDAGTWTPPLQIPINITNGDTYTVSSGQTATISDNITGCAICNMNKSGKGTLKLRGDNSNMLGGLNINEGILNVANRNNLSTKISLINFQTPASNVVTGNAKGLQALANDITAAIIAYAYNPTATNKSAIFAARQAYDAAIAAAQNNGSLATLQVENNITVDGNNGETQKVTIQAGMAGNVNLSSPSTTLNFINENVSSDYGAFLASAGSFLSFKSDNSTSFFNFSNNKATNQYAAAICNRAAVVSGNNINFSNNSAPGGTAITSRGLTLLKNTNFTNNGMNILDNESGGAIYNYSTAASVGYLLLDSVFFDGNFSTGAGGGGAIYNGESVGGTNIITGFGLECHNNFAQSGGFMRNNVGAVVIDGFSITNNKTCDSLGNMTIGGGGAIYTGGGRVVLLNGIFQNNKAGTDGGAIYSVDSLILQNVQFNQDSAGRWGGAIFSMRGLKATDVNFSKNTARQLGGALYVAANTLWDNIIDLNVTDGNTSVFSGNVMGEALTPNSIYLASNTNFNTILTINTDGAAIMDMRDPLTGVQNAAHNQNIYKNGTGIWKLGGTNTFTQTNGQINFVVNKGTLYLYGQNEIANATTQNTSALVNAGKLSMTGTGTNFTLGNSTDTAILVAGGGNVVAANAVTINPNTTIKFASPVIGDTLMLTAMSTTISGLTLDMRLDTAKKADKLLISQNLVLGTERNTINITAVVKDTFDIIVAPNYTFTSNDVNKWKLSGNTKGLMLKLRDDAHAIQLVGIPTDTIYIHDTVYIHDTIYVQVTDTTDNGLMYAMKASGAKILAYPNPTKAGAAVRLKGAEENTIAELYDAKGYLLFREPLKNDEIIMPMIQGEYLLHLINTKNNRQILKIIVIN